MSCRIQTAQYRKLTLYSETSAGILALHPQCTRRFSWQPPTRESHKPYAPLLPQSRDNSRYVSRPILAPPPL